jgi:hypothetical protein
MLASFGRCGVQFLFRKVKNRTVGQPFRVAFAALSHPSPGQVRSRNDMTAQT